MFNGIAFAFACLCSAFNHRVTTAEFLYEMLCQKLVLESHTDDVFCVALSSDGSSLISTDSQGTLASFACLIKVNLKPLC